MVHIHLISPNQRGVTEALTVFIVMLFLPVKKAGGIRGRGGFNTGSFVQRRNEFCQLSLSPGYWRKLAPAKYSLPVIDVTACVVPLKGNKEFRVMWINRDRVGGILFVWGEAGSTAKGPDGSIDTAWWRSDAIVYQREKTRQERLWQWVQGKLEIVPLCVWEQERERCSLPEKPRASWLKSL